MVQQGQLLGTVCDMLGEEIRQVRAAESRIVLVLRTFPRIHKGETLGGIAEIESVD